MPKTVNIHEAKTHLSRLLVQVSEGEEVIIAKSGKPLAKLVSLAARKPRVPGRFLGEIQGVDELLQPDSPEETAPWEGGSHCDPLHFPIPGLKNK